MVSAGSTRWQHNPTTATFSHQPHHLVSLVNQPNTGRRQNSPNRREEQIKVQGLCNQLLEKSTCPPFSCSNSPSPELIICLRVIFLMTITWLAPQFSHLHLPVNYAAFVLCCLPWWAAAGKAYAHLPYQSDDISQRPGDCCPVFDNSVIMKTTPE